ncbi:MAG: hypothetical protein QN168_03635 [Armatimonadota bacterium]|nr:hypothetical protein [Armatimonadota bacterium]
MNSRAAGRRAQVVPAILLAVLLVGSPEAGAQEDIPVTLRARRFQYDRATRTLVATGDVVVVYQDVTISADRLQANLATNDVLAEGHVAIEVGRSQVRGTVLEYNLTTRRGRIQQAEADYRGPPVLGTVHLRAAVVEGLLGGVTTAREGFCTTCDGLAPLVYLTAREFQVFPNDKIIGRQVSVWIGGRRLLTWPYFIVFLREPRASQLLPVAGYSEVEGYYLKTFYTYALNPDQFGYLRLDLMERLGTGYGLEHTYRSTSATGSAFLYRLDNRRTSGNDFRLVLNHQQRLGEVNARLYTDYLTRSGPFFRTTDTFLSLDSYYAGPRFSTTLYQSFTDRDFGGFGFWTYAARVLHTHQLAPALRAEILADFSRSTSMLGADDELFPRLTLQYQGPGYTASLIAEGRIDLDADRFPGDFRAVTERLPELTFATELRPLGGTQLGYRLLGGVGRFRQVQFASTIEAVRTDLGLNLSGPLIESDREVLTLYAEARLSGYTTGDVRGFAAGRAEFTRYLGDVWTLQVGLTYQDEAGRTPFTFDRLFTRVAQAEATLTYRRLNLTVAGNTSFDAMAGRLAPVVVRAQYAPRPDWVVASALSYEPVLGQLARAELSFDVRLSPDWHASYYGFYDGFSREVFHDRLTITRFWEDCLATAVTYRGRTREIWLETWLTALPWARGRVGVGSQGNILFEQPWLSPRP